MTDTFLECLASLFDVDLEPLFPDNWLDTVSEPSPEELAQMDENAASLLADILGE